MDLPPVVSRNEWLVARKQLLAKEKELNQQRDVLNAERRRLPMVNVDKDYIFEGPDGEATLLDVFEGRRQLIVYHFMWRWDLDAGCPSCSFLVDSIGDLSHLHAANTTLAIVSRGPWATLKQFKARMGWTVPFYSSFGSDLNYFKAQSPLTIAEKYAAAVAGKTKIRVAVGERDFTASLNIAYSEHLKKFKVDHELIVVPGVAHEAIPLLKGLGEANWGFYCAALGKK